MTDVPVRWRGVGAKFGAFVKSSWIYEMDGWNL